MNSEEALKFINSRFEQQNKEVLNELETTIFLGCWENEDYTEIAANTYVTEQHVRAVGAKLCKKITNILGSKVTKTNFKPPIEYRYQQQSALIKPPPPLLGELNKPANPPNCENTLTNPFIPQNGIVKDPKQFFDRKQEIDRIFEILNSGSSVALIGEEGIGKSSLLWAIYQQAESRLHLPRQPVFLDLNLVDDEDDFYSALCNDIGITESKGNRLNRALKSHRILLALDNVGKLTWNGFTRQIRDRLRGLAEGSDAPLKLILAASEPLDDLFKDSQDGSKTSPLAGICLEEEIKPWKETTMRNFITARLAKTSVSFTEEKINQLLQESCGHPRRLMQLCYRTYSQYLEAGK